MTFREVARQAGVSLGVASYHFRQRRDLLAGAFALHLQQTDDTGGEFTQGRSQLWDREAASLDDITTDVIGLLAKFVHDDRDSFVAGLELTLELTRDPTLGRDVRDALGTHRREVESLVAQVGSTHAAIDAEILSAAFEGLALKWLAHADDPDFEQRLRPVVRRLVSKFLRQPQSDRAIDTES